MNPLTLSPVSIETALKRWAITLLTLAFIGYGLFQARSLIIGPTIELHGELAPVQTERAIELVGSAHNAVTLTLNGTDIHTNAEGAFRHTLTLEHGFTIVTLEARDRYGRTTAVQRGFVYGG